MGSNGHQAAKFFLAVLVVGILLSAWQLSLLAEVEPGHTQTIATPSGLPQTKHSELLRKDRDRSVVLPPFTPLPISPLCGPRMQPVSSRTAPHACLSCVQLFSGSIGLGFEPGMPAFRTAAYRTCRAAARVLRIDPILGLQPSPWPSQAEG